MCWTKKTLSIINELGIHARPAAMMVHQISELNCDITITKDGETVNGKSIMGVLMLAAECGSEIEVAAKGPDSEKAIDVIENLIKSKFNED